LCRGFGGKAVRIDPKKLNPEIDRPVFMSLELEM
jgi:hypothetical protein